MEEIFTLHFLSPYSSIRVKRLQNFVKFCKRLQEM